MKSILQRMFSKESVIHGLLTACITAAITGVLPVFAPIVDMLTKGNFPTYIVLMTDLKKSSAIFIGVFVSTLIGYMTKNGLFGSSNKQQVTQ